MSELQVIHKQIAAISDPKSCDRCPNIKNKPENEGCGLDVCLAEIHRLSQQIKTLNLKY